MVTPGISGLELLLGTAAPASLIVVRFYYLPRNLATEPVALFKIDLPEVFLPMSDNVTTISDSRIPRACDSIFQHLLDTYASETNKVVSVWLQFSAAEIGFRPHERSSSVEEIMKHQLLSERRFFGEFLGLPEPPASEILPEQQTPAAYARRLVELALPRLNLIADKNEPWWLEQTPFFDVVRERIWIFWRRVLHTAHHRTQLTVYLRLLGKAVPSTYGPTADVIWAGADPTRTVDAAGRK